jgi:hypothetical protein
MHGGAAGSGAPKGPKNGNYKHGRYTKEVAAARRWLREATQMLRELNKRPLMINLTRVVSAADPVQNSIGRNDLLGKMRV